MVQFPPNQPAMAILRHEILSATRKINLEYRKPESDDLSGNTVPTEVGPSPRMYNSQRLTSVAKIGLYKIVSQTMLFSDNS